MLGSDLLLLHVIAVACDDTTASGPTHLASAVAPMPDVATPSGFSEG